MQKREVTFSDDVLVAVDVVFASSFQETWSFNAPTHVYSWLLAAGTLFLAGIRSIFVLIDAICLFQRKIDIVKIDIESDEWICLRHMLADGTLRSHVRQLDVEYHIIMTSSNALREYYSTVKWLERQGFRIFHSRRNPYCSECWEMSYINTNLVDLPLNWEF